MATLWVGSRKGLFCYDEGPNGWQVAGPPAFLAAPVSMLLDDPRDGALYVALAHGHFGCKLHRSDDRGATWVELPAPAFPRSDAPDAPALELIWELAPGGPDQPGVLWLGTIPGGLFRSDDRGQTWRLNAALWNDPSRPHWFGGGYDHPGIHSILVDPRDSAHVTLGISTAGVWTTRDGGASWRQIGQGMRADYMPPERSAEPVVQDVHRLVQSPSNPDRLWCQHHCSIFVSDDGGESFREGRGMQPTAFGFAVAAHPEDPDRAWFVPGVKDECRVPKDGRLVVSTSGDGGRSFQTLSEGLPQDPAWDLIYRHCLAVDATGDRLAMGSTTGNLWVSGDGGDNWRLLSGNLPPVAVLAFAP